MIALDGLENGQPNVRKTLQARTGVHGRDVRAAVTPARSVVLRAIPGMRVAAEGGDAGWFPSPFVGAASRF